MLSLPSTMCMYLSTKKSARNVTICVLDVSRFNIFHGYFAQHTLLSERRCCPSLAPCMYVSLRKFQPEMLQSVFLDAPEINIFHGYFTQHILLSERRCPTSLAPCMLLSKYFSQKCYSMRFWMFENSTYFMDISRYIFCYQRGDAVPP